MYHVEQKEVQMSAYDLYRELGDMDSNAAVVVDNGTEWVDVLGFRLVSDDDDGEIYEAITDDIICPECRSEAEAEADTRDVAAWLAGVNAAHVANADTYDPDGDEYIEGADLASPPERTAEEFTAGIDVDRAGTVLALAKAHGCFDAGDGHVVPVRAAIRDEILRVLAQ